MAEPDALLGADRLDRGLRDLALVLGQDPGVEALLRQGEAADAAYIIVDGRCEVSREENGQTRVLRIMEAGEVFGETAILAGSPRTASVKALSDLTLYAIRGEVFTREVGNWNPLVAQFVKTLALRAGEEG